MNADALLKYHMNTLLNKYNSPTNLMQEKVTVKHNRTTMNHDEEETLKHIAASDAVNTQHELRFNHPVKELVWTVGNKTRGDVDQLKMLFYNLTDMTVSNAAVVNTSLLYKDTNITGSENSHEGTKESIPHVYSFALKPEEHQPSGTCNFSRIDNAVLNMNFKGNGNCCHTLRVYAVNYNVLRIMSGMGGLAYSN